MVIHRPARTLVAYGRIVDTRNRALTAVIAVLGAVPVASGTLGILGGTAAVPGNDDPRGNPSLESEYRFVNTFWLAAGLGLWWSVREPTARAGTTRSLLAVAGLGGLPRLLAWKNAGRPHPAFRGALALELVGMPAVLAWHRSRFP